MPTGNEYQDVRLGSGDQSYKQTDREMADGNFGQSTGQTAPQPASGQYPNTFDRAMGSEPLGTESDNNPFYYPNKAYDYIKCSGPGQSYVQTERESIGGEFNVCRPGETGPYPGDSMVPEPVPSKQFSSKMSGNPEELCRATMPDVMKHSDINATYGLYQPVQTLGSHPWLRDQLTNTTEREPGNMTPDSNVKLPKRG